MDEIKRDFKGVWVPAEIWIDNELTWMEKLFLTEINSLDNKHGCWASNAYFSKFFNLSIPRVSQVIGSLIDKKYISAEYIMEGKQIKKRVLNILKGYLGKYKDNNTNDFLLHKKSISGQKQSASDKKSNFTPNSYEVKLIEYWNSLQLTPKHKEGTKTYLNACKVFRRLHQGTFSQFYKLDADYKEKNGIENKLIHNQWTYDDIKKGLKHLSLLYKEGYWPYDKTKVSRSLPDLLFNTYRNTSFFLKLYNDQPQQLNAIPNCKPKDDESYKGYRKLFDEQIKNVKDEEKLILMINDIHKFFKIRIPKVFKKDRFWLNYFKTPSPLLKEHIRWLGRRKDLYFSFLDTESSMFTKFLIYLKSLRSGQWNFLEGRKTKEVEEKDEFAHLKNIVG